MEIGRRERKRMKEREGVDRHLFILDPVFARLHEVHIINTRGNSLRRPPNGLNTLMHITNTRDNILERTRNGLRMNTASRIKYIKATYTKHTRVFDIACHSLINKCRIFANLSLLDEKNNFSEKYLKI